MIGNFFESGPDDFEPTITVGSFRNAQIPASFDGIFEESCDNFKKKWKMDFRNAVTKANFLDNNSAAIAGFKNDLLHQLYADCEEMGVQPMFEDGDCGTAPFVADQVSKLFDNKVDEYITESANVGDLLPIKSIDFPLLVKSQIKESFKDVVGEEISPSLTVKKRIEHMIVYDRNDPTKTWEYPQCMYEDGFKDMMKAGEGIDLDTTPQNLPLYQFNLVEDLTDVTSSINRRVVIDLRIEKVLDQDDNVIVLRTPIQVNLADGAWVGGVIDQEYEATTTDTTTTPPTTTTTKKRIQDILSGFTDWNTNTTTLTSANTTGNGVKAVIFTGKLSNDGNDHAIRTRYLQEDREWHIGEGSKVEASYTLEELQEHKALATFDLYKRSYNDLVILLSAMADRNGYDWLDMMYNKYKGVTLNPLDWNPVVMETEFDCDSTTKTVALPSEYIYKELKFKIDRFLIDIADTLKLENLHFVCYGNPRYISLLNPVIKWVFNAGQSIGGVKLDYSYGVMTSGDVKIYVVSSKLIDAKKHHGIRLIPFFDGGITFKRYKFSTDVVTSKESAYKDPTRAGGSMTYVWGVSRYENVGLQAVQGGIEFQHDDFIHIH